MNIHEGKGLVSKFCPTVSCAVNVICKGSQACFKGMKPIDTVTSLT